jgi:Protein of unknown function (DUF3618)
MDTAQDRTAEDVRLVEIRHEIAAARKRIAESIDALEYKADVPARIGDSLASAASSVTARILDRLPSSVRGDRGVELAVSPEPDRTDA